MQIKHHRRAVAAAATLMVLTLTAAACGGGGDSGGSGSVGSTGEAPVEFDTAATFTWAHSVPITSMDPHLSTNVYDYPYLFNVYDRLTYLNPKGEAEPMLAESWEVQQDGKALQFTLRKDVKFSDGTPFNAEAVKANFDRMRDNPKSSLKGQVSSIVSETVVDEFTVTLNLASASAGALPAILSGFPGTMVSPAKFDDPTVGQLGAGSGPYVVVDNKGPDGITLEKNPDYWDPEVQRVAKIVMKAIPDDETRFNAVLTGAVDAALIRAPQEQRATAGGLTLVSNIAASPTSLEINMTHAEFDDKRVRQAIAHALNRQEISDAAFGGTCEPQEQVFNKNHWAHSDELGEPYAFDIEKAKALMKEAGLEAGFSFDLITNPSPVYQTAVEVIQAQLAKINVQAKIRVLPAPDTTTEYWTKRVADANITVDALVLDPSTVINTFTGPTGFRNVANYVNAELNDLAAQATAIDDRDERKKLYGQILKIMLDEAISPIVICFQKQTWAFTNGAGGFSIGDSGMWDFRNVAKAKK